jgi:hypothetical protein
MQQLDNFSSLCNLTDGRDKIYKALGGAAKVLGSVPNPHAKKFAALSKAIGDGRSLMRMGKWTSNISKIEAQASKAGSLTTKQMVEIARVLGDFGYVVGDNVTYLAKFGLFGPNVLPKSVAAQSKVFQFYGFVCAIILDVYNLIKEQTAEVVNTKKVRECIISLIKNTCDFLACLAAVGYAKPLGYNPSGVFTGMCSFTSGAIATHANWKKITDKKK